MKKKSILLVTLSTLMAASLGLGVLTACNSAEEVKASEYVNGTNFYYGDGQDVHLQGWITSVTNDAWTVEEGFVDEDAEGAPTVTKLGYSKNDAWRNFGVKIDGNYSDFSYLNITMRAETRGLTPGAVNVNMKIVNPIPEKDGVNVLGSDLYFDVSMDTYTTYSFQIPSIYREILDVTNDVCLFPEPGIANSDVIHAGDIYVKDMWFSKERPADGVTPVDDTWRTEAWCGYEVTRGGESEAIISYNRPADWSRFYRPVPHDEIFLEDGTVNNMLKLQFTSDTVTIGETVYEDSVEQFQVGLWGNVKPGSSEGYYQQWFGQYYRDKYEDTQDWSNNPSVFKVEKDEDTGIVTLYCRVAPALMAMEGNYDEQIWICFNLESQPQGGGSDQAPGYIHGPVEFDGIGQMTILSSEFYFDKNEPVYSAPIVNDSGWNSSVAGAYTVSSEKAGVIANVTYEDLPPDKWYCVAYAINGTAEGNTLTIQLKNNGEEKVLYGIDWNDANARKYGYIEPGATAEIKLQNAAMTGPVNLFLDSCYPGYDSSVTDLHSGDVDIVSMEFTNEVIAPPEEPDDPVDAAWGVVDSGKSLYTITGGEEIDANVQYSGVSSGLWANLYRDVSADECRPNVKLTLRNNGKEKVLYGADLGPEETRKYGWIEPGQTVTVELNNENVYTVINLFLDCCYQGDYTTDKDTLSGNVDIVSVEFVEDVAPDPDPDPDPDPEPVPEPVNGWGVVENGAGKYMITGKDGVLANVRYEGVTPNLWANLYRNVTADECRPNVKLTLHNNGEEKVLYGAELGALETRKYGWIEPGDTVEVKLTNAVKYTVINLFLDCCYGGDYTTDKETMSGNVDIVSLEFVEDVAPDPDPSALNWTTTAANLSVKDGVVTLNNLMDGAWQGVSADLTLDAGGKITIPVTNNTNAIAKFKLSVMYNNDQGGWSDLEGNGTTICWLEIPKGETWKMELTVSASDAPKVAHIMLMVACWDENGMQADGTTPRPEPPYTGTVTIGAMTFTPDATQPPVSEGTVVNVTWGTTAANLSVSEKTVTLNNLPIGTWQNVNADLTLSGACKVTLSITNNTGDVAKFKLQLMDAAWKQIGGDTDPCVCWMEIASGETMELTLTVTAEQAARVARIMLMVNCWVSGDVVTGTEAPCPAGPYTGNIVLGDVKVS